MTNILLIRTVNHNSSQKLTCTGRFTELFLALAKYFEWPFHMFLENWRKLSQNNPEILLFKGNSYIFMGGTVRIVLPPFYSKRGPL